MRVSLESLATPREAFANDNCADLRKLTIEVVPRAAKRLRSREEERTYYQDQTTESIKSQYTDSSSRTDREGASRRQRGYF